MLHVSYGGNSEHYISFFFVFVFFAKKLSLAQRITVAQQCNSVVSRRHYYGWFRVQYELLNPTIRNSAHKLWCQFPSPRVNKNASLSVGVRQRLAPPFSLSPSTVSLSSPFPLFLLSTSFFLPLALSFWCMEVPAFGEVWRPVWHVRFQAISSIAALVLWLQTLTIGGLHWMEVPSRLTKWQEQPLRTISVPGIVTGEIPADSASKTRYVCNPFPLGASANRVCGIEVSKSHFEEEEWTLFHGDLSVRSISTCSYSYGFYLCLCSMKQRRTS